MMVCLENVLSERLVSAFASVLDGVELFEPGARTAGRAAKARKDNLQAKREAPEAVRITERVRKELGKHTVFRRFAVPAKFGRVLLSRYEAGMTYGAHFDEAFIDGVRTDLSFTVFLSDPDTYEGGELELYSPMGSQAIKLPAGCAVVYPSDQLHAVRPVVSGVRLAVVGWLQSRVRSAEQRQLLFELSEATQALESGEPTAAALDRLKLVRNNLLRIWAG